MSAARVASLEIVLIRSVRKLLLFSTHSWLWALYLLISLALSRWVNLHRRLSVRPRRLRFLPDRGSRLLPLSLEGLSVSCAGGRPGVKASGTPLRLHCLPSWLLALCLALVLPC